MSYKCDPRPASTYRAARRNFQRMRGGLSKKFRGKSDVGAQNAKHYKQTREAARRRRQMAERNGEVA